MHDIRDASFTTQPFRLTREEFHGAVKATGLHRRQRRLAAAGAVLFAAMNAAFFLLEIPPNRLLLGAAAGQAVLGVVLPPVLTALSYRAWRRKGEREGYYVMDGDGLACHGGEELLRMPWSLFTGYRETDRMFVLLWRKGRKQWFLTVPKRLLTGPGEAELLGALLEDRIGRR
ncbi:YcxB family protein [Streptomyces sp. NPDC090445]|uniref:YcxB family protein n=1 Tax=Streptomyces sp. NPDC090445 TaxID=3365963 RepID=UPI003811935D